MTIQAPNEEEFQKFVEENKQTIVDFFTRAEMNRQISMLEEKHSNFISQKEDSLFGCDIWLPAELANSKTGKDFFWASTNTGTADRNFVMYSYPYTDKDTFTKEYFVHKRDSVMKAKHSGIKEGVYISTDSLLTRCTSDQCTEQYSQWKHLRIMAHEGGLHGWPVCVSHASG